MNAVLGLGPFVFGCRQEVSLQGKSSSKGCRECSLPWLRGVTSGIESEAGWSVQPAYCHSINFAQSSEGTCFCLVGSRRIEIANHLVRPDAGLWHSYSSSGRVLWDIESRWPMVEFFSLLFSAALPILSVFLMSLLGFVLTRKVRALTWSMAANWNAILKHLFSLRRLIYYGLCHYVSADKKRRFLII